jgi:effector-binding domain-containing protein
MTDQPQIITIDAEEIAVIHGTLPEDEIRYMIGPTLQELLGTIAEQGVKPSGPWFNHHLRRPTDSFDFEVGVPVPRAIAPAGRVRPSEWPAMKAARTVYHGDYEGLGDA